MKTVAGKINDEDVWNRYTRSLSKWRDVPYLVTNWSWCTVQIREEFISLPPSNGALDTGIELQKCQEYF